MLDRAAFVNAFGWIFEHSPWVAERAFDARPFASLDALHAALTDQVERATFTERLALLQAHPDLGARARLSQASAKEQAGAGLDSLTPAEFEQLHRLNAAYRTRFGFPFLLAVKGSHQARRLARASSENGFCTGGRISRGAPAGISYREVSAGGLDRNVIGQFASGWKRNYYGKGDVIVYRLNRDGKTAAGASPVFGASITILIYGDAFWPTYTTGDNTGLIATDSMKNFVQREMLNYDGRGSGRLLPLPGREVPATLSAGGGRANVGRRNPLRGSPE